jgi:hypothetical protein
MKLITQALIFAVYLGGTLHGRGEIHDPKADYLARALRENGDLNETYYADDKVVQIDMDLNADGVLEAFVSLARDRLGREGNNWMAYRKAGVNFEPIGRIVFNSSRFYLGSIDEIGRYGLVNFSPSGAGEGILTAYTYDGAAIHGSRMGEVAMDRTMGQPSGENLLAKYLEAKATLGETLEKVTSAQEFGAKYRIKIETITHREAVQKFLSKREAGMEASAGAQGKLVAPAAGTKQSDGAPSASVGARAPGAPSTKQPSGQSAARKPSEYFITAIPIWARGLMVLVVVFPLIVLLVKRR